MTKQNSVQPAVISVLLSLVIQPGREQKHTLDHTHRKAALPPSGYLSLCHSLLCIPLFSSTSFFISLQLSVKDTGGRGATYEQKGKTRLPLYLSILRPLLQFLT